jgi:hypothetical protein
MIAIYKNHLLKKVILRRYGIAIFLLLNLQIVSAQNVGINNTSPKSTLDVNGSFGNSIRNVTATATLTSTDATILASGGITLTLPSSSGNDRRVILVVYNSSYGGSAVTIKPAGTDDIISNNVTYTSSAGMLLYLGSVEFQNDGSGNWYCTINSGAQTGNGWLLTGNSGTTAGTNFIGTTDAIDLVVKTNNTEKMRMTSGGNLGIGTVSPTNLLSLDGQSARTIWMERNTTASTGGNGLTLQSGGAHSGGTNLGGGNLTLSSGTSTGTGTSNIYFNTATAGSTGTADNSPSTKVTFLGNGMVGIGTSSPTSNLHIYGTTNSGLTPTYPSGSTATVGPEIGFSRGGFSNPGASIQMMDYNAYSSGLCFNVHKGTNNGGNGSFADNWPTDVVQAMTIDNMGHVGIGTASPTSYLQVNGSLALPITSVNAAITLDATYYTVIMTGNSASITLPTASSYTGRIYVLVNQTAAARSTSAYFNFSNISTLTVAAHSSITVQSNGTNWIQVN